MHFCFIKCPLVLVISLLICHISFCQFNHKHFSNEFNSGNVIDMSSVVLKMMLGVIWL